MYQHLEEMCRWGLRLLMHSHPRRLARRREPCSSTANIIRSKTAVISRFLKLKPPTSAFLSPVYMHVADLLSICSFSNHFERVSSPVSGVLSMIPRLSSVIQSCQRLCGAYERLCLYLYIFLLSERVVEGAPRRRCQSLCR